MDRFEPLLALLGHYYSFNVCYSYYLGNMALFE